MFNNTYDIYEYSSSMSSRLVSILAPYLTLYLPGLTFDQLPFIVFGMGTLLGQWFFNFLTILPILDILENQITPARLLNYGPSQ